MKNLKSLAGFCFKKSQIKVKSKNNILLYYIIVRQVSSIYTPPFWPGLHEPH